MGYRLRDIDEMDRRTDEEEMFKEGNFFCNNLKID